MSSRISDDPFSVHQLLISCVPQNTRILEIGCAAGYITCALVKKNCQVTAVEINPYMAKTARKYAQTMIAGDIETKETVERLGDKKFDCLILADVLEHLKDPQATLKKLAGFLIKKGEVYISVPNIGFITNRLLHLLGRWDYMEYGSMDRTHLQFFTKKTIEKLILNCGLRIKKSEYIGNFTQLPLFMQTIFPLVQKQNWWRRVEAGITNIWPAGLAFQFFYVCQKN